MTQALAPDALVSPLPVGGGMVALFASIRSGVGTKGGARTPVEADLRKATEEIGASLLGAGSRDDLDDRIDHEIPYVELLFLRRHRDLFDALNVNLRSEDETVERAIGQGDLLHELDELIEAQVHLLSPFVAFIGFAHAVPTDPSPAELRVVEMDPLWFVQDPRCPPAVALAQLAALQGAASMLAIGHAVATGAKPQPWISRALAEKAVDGARKYLALLQAITRVTVPPSLLPAGELIDLDAAVSQTRAADRAFSALANEAISSGSTIFPPLADDS